jgi:hypothetical protein
VDSPYPFATSKQTCQTHGNCHRDRQHGKKPSREIVYPVEVHQLFGEAEISRKADFAPSPPFSYVGRGRKETERGTQNFAAFVLQREVVKHFDKDSRPREDKIIHNKATKVAKTDPLNF